MASVFSVNLFAQAVARDIEDIAMNRLLMMDTDQRLQVFTHHIHQEKFKRQGLTP